MLQLQRLSVRWLATSSVPTPQYRGAVRAIARELRKGSPADLVLGARSEPRKSMQAGLPILQVRARTGFVGYRGRCPEPGQTRAGSRLEPPTHQNRFLFRRAPGGVSEIPGRTPPDHPTIVSAHPAREY